MNIDKFTQKSIEAVNGCEKLAMEYGNQEIEQEHLLYSLLTLDDSLILKLVEKMEIQKIIDCTVIMEQYLPDQHDGGYRYHHGA